MALLAASSDNKKKQIRVNIDATVLDSIKRYCDFANIKKTDEFFEKAATFVLSKDKDWKAHQATKKS